MLLIRLESYAMKSGMLHYFRLLNLAVIFFLLVLFVLALTSSFITNGGTASASEYYIPQTKVMTDFVNDTNNLRITKGLDALQPSSLLEQSAKAKLADMDQKNYWDHYAPDGKPFSDFIWDQDKYANRVGENLAHCFKNHDAAFNGFLNSPAHYQLLVGDFAKIGIASATDKNGCESIVLHVSK